MLHGMIDHTPGEKRSAGDPRREILVVMRDQATRCEVAEDPGAETIHRHSQAGLLAKDLGCTRAEGEVNGPALTAEHLEQPDGIGRPARAGHGHDQLGRSATWLPNCFRVAHRVTSPEGGRLPSLVVVGFVPT